MQKQGVYFSGKNLKGIVAGIIFLLLSVFLVLAAACGGSIDLHKFTLELMSYDYSVSNDGKTADFSESELVLRCTSFEQNNETIIIETSKSKNLKPTMLVFVRPGQSGSSGTDYFQLVAVPILGKEYEYDPVQAKFYHVTYSSMYNVLKEYGIPYLDWQIGACSTSEKFPCCE